MATFKLGGVYQSAHIITSDPEREYVIASNIAAEEYDVFAVNYDEWLNSDGSVNAEALGSFKDSRDAEWAVFEHMAEYSSL